MQTALEIANDLASKIGMTAEDAASVAEKMEAFATHHVKVAMDAKPVEKKATPRPANYSEALLLLTAHALQGQLAADTRNLLGVKEVAADAVNIATATLELVDRSLAGEVLKGKRK